jgi:hypothetical protein
MTLGHGPHDGILPNLSKAGHAAILDIRFSAVPKAFLLAMMGAAYGAIVATINDRFDVGGSWLATYVAEHAAVVCFLLCFAVNSAWNVTNVTIITLHFRTIQGAGYEHFVFQIENVPV